MQIVFIRILPLSLLCSLLIGIIPAMFIPSSVPTATPVVHVLTSEGDGPQDTCITTLSLNLIESGVMFLLCHLQYFLDTYVAATRNLFDTDALAYDYQQRLFLPMKAVGVALLPAVFCLQVGMRVLENAFIKDNGTNIYTDILHVIKSICIILVFQQAVSFIIGFNNALCDVILHIISPAQPQSLSILLNNAIHLDSLTHAGIIPAFADSILWVALLVSFLMIAIFFVIRFILIWIIVLVLPVLISLDMIPVMQQLKESLIVRSVQLLAVQPIFLLALGFFLVVMQQPLSGITQFVLSICCLFTLSLLPGYIAGLTGGRVGTLSSTRIKELYHGVAMRGSILLDAMQSREPTYIVSEEKPHK